MLAVQPTEGPSLCWGHPVLMHLESKDRLSLLSSLPLLANTHNGPVHIHTACTSAWGGTLKILPRVCSSVGTKGEPVRLLDPLANADPNLI